MIDTLRHVQIETIAGCNARCTMCPVPTMRRKRGRMTADLFQRIVDQAVKMGVRKIVPFLNGEPLLDPAIVERVRYICDAGASTHLNTNAARLTPDLAAQLAELPLTHITVSMIGGTRAAYEHVMQLDYEAVKANVEHLISIAPFPVRVYMTEFEDTAGTVEQFRATWGERAWVGVYANWAGQRPSEFANMQPPQKPCGRVLERMTVLWDGRVSLCCLDSEGTVILGDLTVDSLADVWAAQQGRRDRHRARDFDMPLCRTCNWNRHESEKVDNG